MKSLDKRRVFRIVDMRTNEILATVHKKAGDFIVDTVSKLKWGAVYMLIDTKGSRVPIQLAVMEKEAQKMMEPRTLETVEVPFEANGSGGGNLYWIALDNLEACELLEQWEKNPGEMKPTIPLPPF